MYFLRHIYITVMVQAYWGGGTQSKGLLHVISDPFLYDDSTSSLFYNMIACCCLTKIWQKHCSPLCVISAALTVKQSGFRLVGRCFIMFLSDQLQIQMTSLLQLLVKCCFKGVLISEKVRSNVYIRTMWLGWMDSRLSQISKLGYKRLGN